MSQILDLINLRTWLVQVADRVPQKQSHKAYKVIVEIDDILWSMLFKEESPWVNQVKRTKYIEVFDNDFDETIKQLREGRLSVREQSNKDDIKNT